MANTPFSLLVAALKGGVEASEEIDAAKKKEADKRKLTQLAFAKEAYKSDLNRYDRLMQMKDTLAATGREGFASSLVNNYKVKEGRGKEGLRLAVNKALSKDPEYMNKILNAYGKITKPSPTDYFRDSEYDKVVGERIKQDNAINKLLFGGRKGPSMFTSKQLKDREASLLTKEAPDIAVGFHEEMSRLGLDIDATMKPSLGGKTVVETYIKHKLADEPVPEWLEEAWKLKAPSATKPRVTTITTTHPDGSQSQQLASFTVDPSTKEIAIHDIEGVTEKRPEAKAEIPRPELLKRSFAFLNKEALKDESGILNQMFEDSSDEAVGSSLISFRSDLADRVSRLRGLEKHRGKELGDIIKIAYEELKPGLSMKEGVPSYLRDLLPEQIQELFKEPTFEKPGGEIRTITTQEQYDALPSGATYKEADGKTYRKP